MADGIWTGERYIPDMSTLGDFAGPGGCRGGSSDSGPGWITTLACVERTGEELRFHTTGLCIVAVTFHTLDANNLAAARPRPKELPVIKIAF